MEPNVEESVAVSVLVELVGSVVVSASVWANATEIRSCQSSEVLVESTEVLDVSCDAGALAAGALLVVVGVEVGVDVGVTTDVVVVGAVVV